MKRPTASETKPSAPTPAEEPNLGERLLSLKQVREKIGVGTSTIYRWLEARKFPEPLQVTDTMVRWRMSDLDAWIAARAPADGGSRQRKKNRVSGRV